MIVYIKSDDFEQERRKLDETLRGRRAMYELMLAQRSYCKADTEYPQQHLRDAEQDAQAHAAAPAGTYFVRRMANHPDIIWIVDKDGKQVFFGPTSEYQA